MTDLELERRLRAGILARRRDPLQPGPPARPRHQPALR